MLFFSKKKLNVFVLCVANFSPSEMILQCIWVEEGGTFFVWVGIFPLLPPPTHGRTREDRTHILFSSSSPVGIFFFLLLFVGGNGGGGRRGGGGGEAVKTGTIPVSFPPPPSDRQTDKTRKKFGPFLREIFVLARTRWAIRASSSSCLLATDSSSSFLFPHKLFTSSYPPFSSSIQCSVRR